MSIEMGNGLQMTFEEYMPEIFLMQTAGASDSPVKTSALAENLPDLREIVQACSSELCTLLDSSKMRKNPVFYSSKMLEICLVLGTAGISRDYSLKWTSAGMMRNGRFSTLNTSEFRRTENDALLSDILEDEVDEKYFLSLKGMESLIQTEGMKYFPQL